MANQYTKNGNELYIEGGYLIRGTLKINMQDVYNYYIIENHSRKETEKYFKLTPRMFEKIRDTLSFKKPKNLTHEINKQTCLEKYGDPTYNNQAKTKQTNLERYGCENVFQAEVIKQTINNTKLERYGNAKFVNPEQTKQTCLERYGYTSANQVPEFKEKKKQTCMEHFGVEYPMQSKEVQSKYNFNDLKEKAFNTKKKNGTTNTSKIQDWFTAELKKIYGEEDVATEYKDLRYPYHCDAYIKSLDLFIELNIYFTHGFHPYDRTSKADKITLDKWQEKAKNSKFFCNAIRVWTKLDPEKQLCAKQNNLNYLMFYTEQEAREFIYKLQEEKSR